MDIEILYKDRDIVVINKPRGLISQDSEKRCVPSELKRQLGVEQIFTVHRLDIETTGVMVYGLNSRRRRNLSAQIQADSFKKEYLALLDGFLPRESGRLEDLLFYDRKKGKSFIVKRERNGVKKRILEYETVEKRQNLALVKVRLFTGRTHQIRAQFANIKAPVLGDNRYGSRAKTCIHLHCHKIEFLLNGKSVEFCTPPEWA